MSDEPRAQTSITDEFSKMGKLMSQAVQTAWESEDRKRLEAEIVEGLRKFGDEISLTAKKAGESDAAQQIRTQAEKVAAEVKQRDVAEDVRKGLIAGLEVINQELGKLVSRLETKPAPVEPAAPVEPPAEAPAPEPPQEG